MALFMFGGKKKRSSDRGRTRSPNPATPEEIAEYKEAVEAIGTEKLPGFFIAVSENRMSEILVDVRTIGKVSNVNMEFIINGFMEAMGIKPEELLAFIVTQKIAKGKKGSAGVIEINLSDKDKD